MPEYSPQIILYGLRLRSGIDLSASVESLAPHLHALCDSEQAAKNTTTRVLKNCYYENIRTIGQLVGVLETWREMKFFPWHGVGHQTLRKLVTVLYVNDSKEDNIDMLIRDDGTVVFWTVEVFSTYIRREWHVVGDHHLSKIPADLRFRNGDPYKGFLDPYRSFGANGNVWQKTGNNGFEEEEMAKHLLDQVSRANRGESFRMVKVTMTMEREPVFYSRFAA